MIQITETISMSQAYNLILEAISMPTQISFKTHNMQITLKIKPKDFQECISITAKLQEELQKRFANSNAANEFNQNLMAIANG